MTAFATESGLTLICPLTGLAYQPSWFRIQVIDDDRYVQSKCRHCDAAGRIRQERDYDPAHPQVHTHLLDAEAQ